MTLCDLVFYPPTHSIKPVTSECSACVSLRETCYLWQFFYSGTIRISVRETNNNGRKDKRNVFNWRVGIRNWNHIKECGRSPREKTPTKSRISSTTWNQFFAEPTLTEHTVSIIEKLDKTRRRPIWNHVSKTEIRKRGAQRRCRYADLASKWCQNSLE